MISIGSLHKDVEPPWLVFVVILNWNGREDTLACLRSLRSSTWQPLPIVVVDNGSDDGSADAVRAEHPHVDVIEAGRNLGFAGGNNVGVEAALAGGADAVLVLNNDTEVAPDAIRRLVGALRDDALAGACSPVLPYALRPERLWFAGAPYDPDRARSGRSSAYETGAAALPERPVVIDRAAGAALLARASVWQELGGFSEELFFLHEDVDWSLRVRAAGWRILLVPAARVAHRVAASQGGLRHTPTTAYYGTRNDLEMGRRHGSGRGWRATARQAGCLCVHLAAVRRAAAGARGACLRATMQGWRDYRTGRFGSRHMG